MATLVDAFSCAAARRDFAAQRLIGSSPAIDRVVRSAQLVAQTESTVLIQGETGTGKELIARLIHEESRRSSKPFLKLNCAAMPAALVESELFGHERGAFTGAFAHRVGRFQAADSGTLFLDEIGDLPLELQPKLLRVLQEQEFERIGSTRSIRVDVRIVAATNQNLAELVYQRRFRSDLFYRLNVFPIMLPPLRERMEDLPGLVGHFAAKFARQMEKPIDGISDSLMETLRGYPWPGNVRELQNVIERAAILSRGPVLRLPLEEIQQLTAIGERAPAQRTLAIAERDHILEVLRESGYVVAGPHGAARRLGLPRTTLMCKMQKLGIVVKRSSSAANGVDGELASEPPA